MDEEALLQAREASYSARDLQPVPVTLRTKYFEETGGCYTFRPDLRRAVIFGRHDLIIALLGVGERLCLWGRICYSPQRASSLPLAPQDALMKRLWRGLSSTAPARNLSRLELTEALGESGCALCRLARRQSQRGLETLLNEAVTDVDQRDTWRHARGLCRWHAGMALETPHSAGSLALLYADVLGHDLQQLAALTAPHAGTRRWRAPRQFVARLHHWLSTWWQRPLCPACHLWAGQEQRYLTVLLDDWPQAALAQAFAASHGLCWPHTQRLVAQGARHVHLQAVLTAQYARLHILQQELQEFIRKLDYRFAQEPYGREADAWLRAMALYVGMQVGQRGGLPPGP